MSFNFGGTSATTGTSNDAATGGAQPTSPGFSSGSSGAAASSGLSFVTTTAATAPASTGISFGQPASSAAPVTAAAPSATTGFSFGSSSTTPAPAAATAPSTGFTFATSSTTPAPAAATAPSTGFTFATSATNPSPAASETSSVTSSPVNIRAADLNKFLASRPLTKVKQTKYSRNRQKKWQYRSCGCGCSYKINLVYSLETDSYIVNETVIPPEHVDVDEKADFIKWEKEVSQKVEKLVFDNKFTRNFGPKRIMTELRRQNVPESKIPSEKQLANKLFYLRKTKFHPTNEIGPVEDKLRSFVFSGNEALEQPFIYHYNVDDNGRLILGDGSDSHPFYVSISSKAMLSVVETAVTSKLPTVLHMNCMTKSNDVEFPLLVLGITDAQQQFHPLSISVLSHGNTEMYISALDAFKRLVTQVLPTTTFLPKYGMTDCEVGERCKDHLKGYPRATKLSVCSGIEYLHCSATELEFNERYQELLSNWKSLVPDFATYFDTQWNRTDSFSNWKIFCSAPGVARTHNAIESFNKIIKCKYHFGLQCCLSALFDVILEQLVVDLSLEVASNRKCYEVRRKPSLKVMKKVTTITTDNYLISKCGMIYYFTKRENSHQHAVNFSLGTCTCRSFLKDGYCKHIICAHQIRNMDSSAIIIDRRFKKVNTKVVAEMQGGCVQDAAPALEKD